MPQRWRDVGVSLSGRGSQQLPIGGRNQLLLEGLGLGPLGRALVLLELGILQGKGGQVAGMQAFSEQAFSMNHTPS